MNPELINYCSLNGLEQPCSGQVGAVKNVYVIRANDVILVPECCDDDHEISEEDPIQIKGGTGFKKYFFLPDQCLFAEISRKTSAGTVWEQRVEGFHPGVRPEVAKEICKLKDGHYIVICELYTGKRILLGDKSNPMQFQSTTTTGRQRRDRNGSEFLFSRQATCPACFISEEADIPNEEGTPYAFLAVINEDPCTPVLVSAVGSTLSDGTTINTGTSGTFCVLRYAFGPDGSPWYVVEIDPDGDATDIASWTYVSGSRTAGQFETEVVDFIQAGGLGAYWTFFPHYLANVLNVTQVSIQMALVEGALVSNVAGRVLLTDPTQLIRIRQTGSTGTIIIEAYRDCIVSFGWGDGSVGAQNLTGGTRTTLSHSYGASGTYDITLATGSAENVKVLELPAVEAFNAEPMPNLLELDLEDADIGDTIDLSDFPKLATFFSRGSGITNVTLSPTQTPGTPAPLLFEFVVPAGEPAAQIDYFPNPAGCDLSIDWGDGTITFHTGTSPIGESASHTFTGSYDRNVKVYGTPSGIQWLGTLGVTYDLSLFELYYNANLTRVLITSCTFVGNKLSLWGPWQNLQIITASSCGLQKFDLGLNTSITNVNLSSNDLSSGELDNIIDQLWQNRAAASATFNLTSNPGTPSATSIDKINGTGAYVGEGLNSDYGWNVTY